MRGSLRQQLVEERGKDVSQLIYDKATASKSSLKCCKSSQPAVRFSTRFGKPVNPPPQASATLLEKKDVSPLEKPSRKNIRVLSRLPHPDGPNAPKLSITACHECRQTAIAHKWCLRSLNCGSSSEDIASSFSSVASVWKRVPSHASGISVPELGQDHSLSKSNRKGMATKRTGEPTVSTPAKRARSSMIDDPSATTSKMADVLGRSTPVAASSQARNLPVASSTVPAAPKTPNQATEKWSQTEAQATPQVQMYYDPYMYMRLDIDHMSYEQLLALQERIGYVSTGLSEDALVKCRNIDVYEVNRQKGRTTKANDADAKCSICQEEYKSGEKLGSLKCEHSYHVACIDQWLRQKNWCPTCKEGVVPA